MGKKCGSSESTLALPHIRTPILFLSFLSFGFNFGKWSFFRFVQFFLFSFSIFILFAVVSPFCARVETMNDWTLPRSTFGSIMCCGSTNDNHEINMSERTSACHPFTSQHTHSCTASPCRHVDDRRRAFSSSEWQRAGEREREINGYNYKQMTRRTIVLSRFIYIGDTTHREPTKTKKSINFSAVVFLSCDLCLPIIIPLRLSHRFETSFATHTDDGESRICIDAMAI